jgi:hypothetical protein
MAMNGKDWSWLPQHMPEVAALLAAEREKHGVAWVNQCWKRGVLQRDPGAFFAAEGALMVGTPTARQMIDWLDPLPGTERPAAVLCLAEPESAQKGGHAGA